MKLCFILWLHTSGLKVIGYHRVISLFLLSNEQPLRGLSLGLVLLMTLCVLFVAGCDHRWPWRRHSDHPGVCPHLVAAWTSAPTDSDPALHGKGSQLLHPRCLRMSGTLFNGNVSVSAFFRSLAVHLKDPTQSKQEAVITQTLRSERIFVHAQEKRSGHYKKLGCC